MEPLEWAFTGLAAWNAVNFVLWCRLATFVVLTQDGASRTMGWRDAMGARVTVLFGLAASAHMMLATWMAGSLSFFWVALTVSASLTCMGHFPVAFHRRRGLW